MQSGPISDEADKPRSRRGSAGVAPNNHGLVHQVREMKPTWGVVIAVGGALAVGALALTLLRRGRTRGSWLTRQPPSKFAAAAKTAGLWAGRILVRRMAQELVTRFSDPGALQQPSQRFPYTPPPGVPTR